MEDLPSRERRKSIIHKWNNGNKQTKEQLMQRLAEIERRVQTLIILWGRMENGAKPQGIAAEG